MNDEEEDLTNEGPASGNGGSGPQDGGADPSEESFREQANEQDLGDDMVPERFPWIKRVHLKGYKTIKDVEIDF